MINNERQARQVGSNERQRWKLPEPESIKVNFGASINVKSGHIGLGMVAQDDGGQLMGAENVIIEGSFEVLMAESLGCRIALKWIHDQGWCKVELETSFLLHQAIKSSPGYSSQVGMIIQDCI